jgi:iron(III) transport system substrate-binding protein
MPMRKWWPLLLAASVILVIALLVWAGRAGTRPTGKIEVNIVPSKEEAAPELPQEEVVKLATERERRLVWYTSVPEETAQAFLKAFQSRYPTIETVLVRDSTFAITAKVRAELQAESLNADVLHVLDVGIFLDLRADRELLAYRSPEYAAFPAEYKDDGYWAAMRAVSICMAYNANRPPPGGPPTTWEDLLRPQWKGRVGLENAQAGSQYAQYYVLRERYGTVFWERMARQKPRFYNSSRLLLDALMAGDVDVAGEMSGYAVYECREEGNKQVQGVWPKDGVPITIAPVAILRQAKHPNAAKLFLDFALSKEGQELCQRLGGAYSVRPDVPGLVGKPSFSELHQLTPTRDWQDYLAMQPKLLQEFTNLFHPDTE